MYRCGLRTALNPCSAESQTFAELTPRQITQEHNVYVFVYMMLFAKKNRILFKIFKAG